MKDEGIYVNNQYMSLLPEYAHRAFERWYDYGANNEKIEEFAGKWGGFEYENFLSAVEQDRGDDRLCAMFALGESLHPDAANVLLPFLHSGRKNERCISAIVLGMKHDPRAYPLLENLLLEGLFVEERMDAITRDDREVLEDLFLCDRFRPKAVELLETWHSPTMVQTMIQTLEALWTLEKTFSQFSIEGRAYDTLCYTLGQRGVFTAVDTFDFLPAYRKIAMVYQILGALHVQRPSFMRWVLKNTERVSNALQEHFRLDAQEAERCIEAFYLENEIRRTYRATRNEQAVEEGLAQHFMVTLDADQLFEGMAESNQEEEQVEQREPRCVCVYREHTSPTWSLAWSPDGTHIVSGSADTTAQVWSWQTRKRISLFRGHSACVTAVAWSPDGDSIASGGSDNQVFVWNAQTAELLTAYTKHRAWICQGLAWSPDGRDIASASWDGSVHIWEARTGKTRLRYDGHKGVVTHVAWSPDGTQIVSAEGYPECAVHVWNATTGQLHFIYTAHMQDTLGVRPLSSHLDASAEAWARGPDSIRSLAWSPDGRWIASAGVRNVFRVWNAQTGEDLLAKPQYRTEGPLTWSRDSKFLATGNRNGVDIWNIEQKRIILNYISVNRYTVTALAWSPDMTHLVAGGEYPWICVWDTGMD